MTESAPQWNELSARLLPFVRRRVESTTDAEDVMQDVLLRVHRGLPELTDETRLIAWVFQIARNAITDHQRGRARSPRLVPVTDALEPTEDPFAEDGDAVARTVARYLSAFVARLPSPFREAVTLTELEGRTQAEAAKMVDVSLSTMKSRVQRGRRKLRLMLESTCEIAVDARGKLVACTPKPLSDIPPDCC